VAATKQAAPRPPAVVTASKPAAQSIVRTAEPKPAAVPSRTVANAQAQAKPAAQAEQPLAGAQPVVQSNAFDSRFSFR
jgi:hypothetical protein